MSTEIDKHIASAQDQMEKALEHLHHELVKVRTGKANPAIVQDLRVNYYGSATPLSQVANIGLSDSRTITIQPWEKSMLAVIEQSIFAANLGLTPMNDGEMIRINVPPLTEERRKELVKQAKHMGEEAKVAVRTIRHKYLDVIKKAVKDGLPEDMGKKKETQVQDMVNLHVEKIDKLIKSKDDEIMKV